MGFSKTNCIFAAEFTNVRAVSSVGLEHYLDRVGVTGSNPVQLTKGKFALIDFAQKEKSTTFADIFKYQFLRKMEFLITTHLEVAICDLKAEKYLHTNN